MPAASAASSSIPVQTSSPFLPNTIAVPVSWHMGRTPPAATLAFLSSSQATKRSLSEASGSSRIDASCARCPGLRKWEMSRKAAKARPPRVSAPTRNSVRPPTDVVSTSRSSRRRHGVLSAARGNIAWKGAALTRPPGARRARNPPQRPSRRPPLPAPRAAEPCGRGRYPPMSSRARARNAARIPPPGRRRR